MAATLSTTFAIEIVQTIAAASAITVAGPGFPFKIMSILGTGLNTSAITVKKNDNSGVTVGVATLASGDLNDFPAAITESNTSFAASDNIYISVATANASKVVILCLATGGGSSLVVT